MSIYAVAGMIAVSVALIAYALLPNKRGEAKETLRRRISERKGGRDPADLLKQQSKESVAQKMLQKVAPLAVRPVMPQNDAEMSKLRIKLATAGFRRENTPTLFLASKTVLAILVALNIADEYFRARDLQSIGSGELNERALRLEQLVDGILAQVTDQKALNVP